MCSLVEAAGMRTSMPVSPLTRATAEEAGPWYQRSVKKGFRKRELELRFEGYTNTL